MFDDSLGLVTCWGEKKDSMIAILFLLDDTCS